MQNRYSFNKRRSYSRPKYSGGNNFSRGRNTSANKSTPYKKSFIKHDQYINKAKPIVNENIYVESSLFSDFNLNTIVKNNVKLKGYKHPTKVQSRVIPEIIKGKDILGLATTGSGKTAAFLLPMITKVMNDHFARCLIVVPTRELANQISNEFKSFSKGTNLLHAVIMGGTGYGPQIKLLNKRPQFVIATPGRLIDLHNTHKINLKSFNNIILDEVDRMLDMGFVRDIELIIANLSNQKQSLFFSATMDNNAEKIARTLLNNPLKIQIEHQDASVNIEQNIIKFKFIGEKINMLHEFLESTEFDKVLVFSKTRRGADTLSRELERRGHRNAVIHGNKSLGQRNKVISQFRQNNIDILVATDVAARGIDIPNISHIINYDEPANYNDYIHRIGRTGRIGKRGVALTFVR